MAKSNSDAYERRLRAQFVRRALQDDTPLLASALHRYAVAEGQTWTELAQALGCSVDGLNQVALCRPPRPESFVADVEAIAADYVDADHLLPLLRRLQVFAAFAERAAEAPVDRNAEPGRAMLLAARDREEEDEGEASQAPKEDPLATDVEDDHA
ncbi:MAG: hypothetical protein JWN14_1474 [Chthonomonadales bacterium]|nr:hypothetical protein [Chthonomonadales bacterium]